MGARTRLNSLNLIGVLLVAALIGGSARSWIVFLVVAGVLTAVLVYGGDIRSSPTPRRPRKRR